MPNGGPPEGREARLIKEHVKEVDALEARIAELEREGGERVFRSDEEAKLTRRCFVLEQRVEALEKVEQRVKELEKVEQRVEELEKEQMERFREAEIRQEVARHSRELRQEQEQALAEHARLCREEVTRQGLKPQMRSDEEVQETARLYREEVTLPRLRLGPRSSPGDDLTFGEVVARRERDKQEDKT